MYLKTKIRQLLIIDIWKPLQIGLASQVARPQLEDVPPETEWFADIGNARARRAYRNGLREFMAYAGIGVRVEI
jgi:hypothetical protein